MLSNEGDEMLEGIENKLKGLEDNIVTVEVRIIEKDGEEKVEEEEEEMKNKEIVIVDYVNINQSSQEHSLETNQQLVKTGLEYARSILENPPNIVENDLVKPSLENPPKLVENLPKALPPLPSLTNSISNLERGDMHVSVPSIKSSSFPNQSFYVETSETEKLD